MVQLKVLLWKWGIIGPNPKFKIGDSVQLIGNDHLLIQKVDLNTRERAIVYTCEWFDKESREVRKTGRSELLYSSYTIIS